MSNELIDALEGLPKESLGELCDFISYLRYKKQRHNGRPAVTGRLCRDLPTIDAAAVSAGLQEIVDSLDGRHSSN